MPGITHQDGITDHSNHTKLGTLHYDTKEQTDNEATHRKPYVEVIHGIPPLYLGSVVILRV